MEHKSIEKVQAVLLVTEWHLIPDETANIAGYRTGTGRSDSKTGLVQGLKMSGGQSKNKQTNK
ncbi:MAG: hypothetical protein EOO05_00210 [Chitinophagaceae bacterium]|nr:MAG: hypothetical protein EOO05_00210 [Chitinophagaceae bacterium]